MPVGLSEHGSGMRSGEFWSARSSQWQRSQSGLHSLLSERSRTTKSLAGLPRKSANTLRGVRGVVLAIGITFAGVAQARTSVVPTTIPAPNFAHFDHLMSTALLKGETVGVLNIYSSAPDYRFVTAPGEGYACVDDAARGIVLLSEALDAGKDQRKLNELELLTKFVLNMQNKNGYFNNFVEPDQSINTTSKTSTANLNWWSLRALWGLGAAYRHLPHDRDLSRRVSASLDLIVSNLKRDLPLDARPTARRSSADLPDWLPAGSGADQAAVAIIGLLPYYARYPQSETRALIVSLADGIVAMQAGDAHRYPYGLHRSWKNTWHAWGSDQPYALLLAGKQLKRSDYVASGLTEIDNFYPYLLKVGYLSDIQLKQVGGHYVALQTHHYPQIAYGIRPMVFAADEAYRITGKQRYRMLARRFATWLTGANSVHRPVYDKASGRVADGIVSPGSINANSGAESTVEGLMTLERLNEPASR